MHITSRMRALSALLPAMGMIFLAGCTDTSVNQDPFEDANREVHEANKALDRDVVMPVSKAYVAVVPSPARTGIGNVVSNLGEPLNFINHTLQGDVQDAGASFFRFAMNTVFGLGGLLDPATDAGLFENDTDFGETMAVWGVPSGAYLELPLVGPSTERDAIGMVVDFAINPAGEVLEGDAALAYRAGQAADLLQDRQEYARVIEAILYESADSYAAARIAYLQNRARNVNQEVATDDLEDPFAFE